MRDKKILFITQAAIIAAIYVVLIYIFNPISFGPVQVRIAEVLTVLPYFTVAAVPGVSIGCFLSNLLTGSEPLDVVFGTLATLVGAIGSYKLRHNKFLVPIPPIVSNTIIMPWVIKFAYAEVTPIPLMMLTVGLGEVVSIGILGMMLLFALEKHKDVIFKSSEW